MPFPLIDSPATYSQGNSETIPLVKRLPLDNSAPDARQIINALAALTTEYGANPEVRRFVEKFLTPDLKNNDIDALYATVYQITRSFMRYVPDPLGVEYVISPLQHIHNILARGFSTGDCDDLVLFFNSLLSSVGIDTRVAATTINGSDILNHVFSMVYLDGKWKDVELCSPDPTVQHDDNRIIA